MQRAKAVDLSTGKEVPIRARKATLPLYVYGEETGKGDAFTPTGLMGDAVSLKKIVSTYDASAPTSTGRTGRTSLSLDYQPEGRKGWAGLYWQTPANNWGTRKGAGFDLSEAEKLTFWIRGEKGEEKVAQVVVGGINGAYPDSDKAVLGPLTLTQEWEKYEIPLEGKDMRHIIGGFSIVFRRADNPRGAKVYLDGIRFEGAEEIEDIPEEPAPPAVAVSTKAPEPPVTVKAPEEEKLTTPIRKVVHFETGDVEGSLDGKAALKEMVKIMRTYGNSPVIVEGHTDSVGSSQANQKLSKARARTVADVLVELGIAQERISVFGMGEENPIVSNDTESGREQNRRVEVIVSPEEVD